MRHIRPRDYKMELISEWANTLLRPKYLVVGQQILWNKSCMKNKLKCDSLGPINNYFFSILTNPFMSKFPRNRNSSSCSVSLILNILFCRLFSKVSMTNLLGANTYWCKGQRQVHRTVTNDLLYFCHDNKKIAVSTVMHSQFSPLSSGRSLWSDSACDMGRVFPFELVAANRWGWEQWYLLPPWFPSHP